MNAAPPALVDTLVQDCVDREGEARHIYLDVKGLPTTAIGHLLHSAMEASRLPFQVDGVPASVAQVSSNFVAVSAMQPGHSAGFYLSPHSPLLPVGYGRDLCRTELLGQYLPGVLKLVPDLYQRPPEVARALVTLAYCTGLGGLASFHHMLASIERRDFQGIVDRREFHLAPPATDATNNRLRDWFSAAAHPSTA